MAEEERHRLALIWSETARSGSGYQVAPHLVLTARHVVGESECATVWLGGTREWLAKVAWRSKESDKLDACLLRLIASPSGTGSSVDRPVGFATAPKNRSVPWEGGGFPRAMAEAESCVRESIGVYGMITAAGGVVQKVLDLTVENPPKSDVDWQGLSGAAVLVDGQVVGLITNMLSRMEGRAHATRIERIMRALPGELRNELQCSEELQSAGPRKLGLEHFAVPQLPPHFLDRDVAVGGLRQMITGEEASRIVGVHGMGGLGKTVLVQALCRDRQILDAFPDGILWLSASVGDAELTEQLHQATGIRREHNPAEQLKTLLRGLTLLLVLDDVVDASQLKRFLPDEERVKVLFTTRDKSTGAGWSAAIYTAPQFDERDAVNLLHRWARKVDPAAPALTQRLACLPVAIRIAGALMALNDLSAEEVLAQLHSTAAHLRIDLYANDPQSKLEACFEVSLQRLPQVARTLFAAFGLLTRGDRIPVNLISEIWKAVRPELTDSQLVEHRRALAHRALLGMEGDRITVHPLLHEYAVEFVGRQAELKAVGTKGLQRASSSSDWITQERAIEALGRIGGEPAFESALRVAADVDADMDARLKALTILQRQPDPRAVPALVTLLKGGYYETTLAAAQALASIGADAVEPLLTALPELAGIGLQDGIRALGWIGDARALPLLATYESNPDVYCNVGTDDGIVRENIAKQARKDIEERVQGG